MAKKLGKKARKFARKNLQSAAKRNRKIRNQFNHRRAPRRGELPPARPASPPPACFAVARGLIGSLLGSFFRPTNCAADALINGLEFPEDDIEIDVDLSDSDGYLSEDPGCPYYSDSEDGDVAKDCIMQDGLDRQNDDMTLAIKKQKKKLKKLLDKDPEYADFLEKWQSELKSYRSKEDSDEEDGVDSMDDDDNSNDGNYPNAKILTSKTISEWCQLVSKKPKSPALRNLLNAFRDACRYGVHSDSPSMQRFQNTRVFYQIITFVLSESDNIFRALLEISDDANKGIIMNLRNSKKWQTVDPLLKSYLRNSLDLLSQLTDNKILAFVLTRLRASAVLFSAYPSTSSRLLKVLFRLWASGDQSLSLSAFLMIREVASLLPDCLDICLTKAYNTYLASTKLVSDRNTKHIAFLMNCLVELYSLDVQKSCESAVTSVEQLNAILRQASKTKGKVPKNLLKSRDFQEECILSAIQVLSAHFAQWSYHVSFPEVATIPLILLKRLHEQTTIESLNRPIKRMIDQVIENKDFIERKREAVSFSPNDKASVDSFLQEKSSGNASLTRFYASMAENRQPRGTYPFGTFPVSPPVAQAYHGVAMALALCFLDPKMAIYYEICFGRKRLDFSVG
ncbi:Nucleolar complex protein 2-like protein [Dichanthelium oligosanthes]|uniref:Nucleolar complex protein 2-like protein n=1 Tax=Dichanthelium oligosanthes TaxID=888268 RepID=A0A1E5UTM6_9POAL|nr:Nucleolar complex protein 2-like protein [Dichanthelium oligosanthes]